MLSFQNTHDAMGAERLLAGYLPVCTMPTLRQVSASCGISLRMEAGDVETFLALADRGVYNLHPSTLYRVGEDVTVVREF